MFDYLRESMIHLFSYQNQNGSSLSNENSSEKTLSDKENAAKRIQQSFREYVQEKGGLSQPSYDEYRQLIQETKFMQRAEGGITAVFLPESNPSIVLKQSGRGDAIKRFEQMEKVRDLLSIQQSSHITVPWGAVVEDFVIEEKLPIQADRFHNMGLYINNPSLFDESIRELAKMFSKLVLTDLVSPQTHATSNIVGNVVRWDNLPLYIEEKDGIKKGKIGLVDLEHVAKNSLNEKNEWSDSAHGYMDLARIFPYHLPILLEEIQKTGFQIDENKMKEAAKKGETYLHVAYVIHDIWIKENEIQTTLNLNLPPSVRDKIAKRLEAELLSIVENNSIAILKKKFNVDTFLSPSTLSPLFSSGSKEIIQDNCKKVANSLTITLLNEMSNTISKEVHDLSKNPERPDISQRSLSFSRYHVYRNATDSLNNQYSFNKRYSSEVADQLFCALCEELVEEKILFSFDPNFRSGGHEICWIRF